MPVLGSQRRVLALIVGLLALVASACGESVEHQPLNASSFQADTGDEPLPWGVEPTVAPLAETPTVAPSRASNEPIVATEVLSLAFVDPAERSFRFTQGVAMDLRMGSLMSMRIAPDEPVAWGEVAGDRSHMVMDMGVLIDEVAGSTGDSSLAGLQGSEIEMWTDGTAMIMDMSQFAEMLDAMGGADVAELDLFRSGPFRIDLSQIPGVASSDVASQYTQGTMVMDPIDLLVALREVEQLRDGGRSQVGGQAVDVYETELSMTEFYTAMGMDASSAAVSEGLALEGLDGVDPTFFIDAMNAVDVELRVMIDADGEMRRMEIDMDMGSLFEAMFSDPGVWAAMTAEYGELSAAQEADLRRTLSTLDMYLHTWQEFEGYGDPITVEIPEARDATAEFAALIDELS